MRSKVKGTILAVVGAVGTVWSLLNFTPWIPWIVAFAFCAVICMDGVATIVTEVQVDRERKKARERYMIPEFLNLDKED